MLKIAASPMLRRVVASSGARVSVVAILTIAMLASVSCETNEVEEPTVGQSPTVTQRPTPEPATVTATVSPRPTGSPSTNATVTPTPVPTATPTQIPMTDEPAQTARTDTPTATPTVPPTVIANPTAVPELATAVPTQIPSPTVVPTPSATQLPAATSTPSPTATPPPVPTPTPSLADVIEKASGSIVKISSRAGSGTGWIFATEDETAYIVSNSHVLPTIHNPTVSVPNLGEYEAEVLGSDRNLDIAVIKICCSQDFVRLDIADASTLRLGDDLTALGYPLGVDSIKVTRTILTGFNTDSTTGREEFTTDASPNAGNRGSPLLTATGEVVGINAHGVDADGEATVFAISSETFGDAIADLKTHPVRTFESPEHIRLFGSGNISVVEGTTNPRTRPIPAASTRQAKNLFVRYTFDVDNRLSDRSQLATSWGVAFRVTSGARYVLVSSTRRIWKLFLERDAERTLVNSGPIRLTGGGTYGLRLKDSFSLLVKEDQGWLFTGDFVYFLDLSEHVVVGELHTIANYLEDDQQPVNIAYTVEAWRIAPVYKAINQSVVSVGDQRVALPAGNVSGRFFAFATFVNPAAPGPGLDSWSYGIALRQSGNIDRMVVVSTDGALDLLSIEGTLIRLWELTSVRLTRSEGASTQLIVGHTNLPGRFDLISANNPEMSFSPVAGDISCFSCRNGEFSINPAVGINPNAPVAGTLVEVPLFEIWAFEKQ